MQISCPCLNLSVEILLELDQILDDEDNLKPPENLQLSTDAVDDEFLSNFGLNLVSIIAKDENASVERIPPLIESRLVSGWDIKKCILCNLDVFAINILVPNQLLCSRSVLKQQLAIAELRNTGRVSSVFRVILPKDSVASTDSAAAVHPAVPEDINRAVQNIFNEFVKKEQELMDERIHRFTEEQQSAFEILKQEAKKERAILLASLFQKFNQGLSPESINDENDYVNSLPSLTAGRPSTSMSVTWQDETAVKNKRDNDKPVPIFFRPKSHSNPVTLFNSKRKRHSGGSAKTSALSSHVEEHLMFNMDDHDTSDSVFADGQAEEIDDKETVKGEDYLSYYPAPPLDEDLEILGRKTEDAKYDDDSDDPVLTQFGTSLPVTIPAAASALNSRIPPFNRVVPSLAEDDETPSQQNPKDVGASMQALARSIQAVDDPERLFGERPRRRWKTGEILQDSSQRFVYAGRRPQAF